MRARILNTVGGLSRTPARGPTSTLLTRSIASFRNWFRDPIAFLPIFSAHRKLRRRSPPSISTFPDSIAISCPIQPPQLRQLLLLFREHQVPLVLQNCRRLQRFQGFLNEEESARTC